MKQVFLVIVIMYVLETRGALSEASELSRKMTVSERWLKQLLAAIFQPHSRQKRVIGLPLDSFHEVEWSLNFPFDTFTFYRSKLRLAILIHSPFPVGITVKRRKRFANVTLDDIQFLDDPFDITRPLAHWHPAEHGDPVQWHSKSMRAARQERASLYKHLEDLFRKAGMDGHNCLLRMICEVADAPFDQGLTGEMINRLLTASVAGQPDSTVEGTEYEVFLEAELHGKLTSRCEERYHQCHTSPFDLIPYVNHTLI
nr:uncharacterized protein LOC128692598 [Cherax quadricarinatus]